MSRQYPIWVEVEACIYGSGKSYGAKDTNSQSIKVGSSSTNSHDLVEFITTKREYSEYKGFKDVIVFKSSLDGVVLKEKIFEDNKGRAGKLLKTNTKLNKIKSL